MSRLPACIQNRGDLHAKQTPEPVNERTRLRLCGIQDSMFHCFVKLWPRLILPCEPSVKFRLPHMGVLEWSTIALRLGNTAPGQSVQGTVLLGNKADQKVLQHSAEPIVGHDPYTEARTISVVHLEATLGDLVRQSIELVPAAVPNLTPSLAGVAVRVDHDAQSFESRSGQLGLDHALLQELIGSIVRCDVNDRIAFRLPCNTIRFHEIGDDATLRSSLHEQLPGMDPRGQLPDLEAAFGGSDNFIVGEPHCLSVARVDTLNGGIG